MNALNAAINTTTSDFCMEGHRTLIVIVHCLILWIPDHLLPGGLRVWYETTSVLVSVPLGFVIAFLAIGISFILYIMWYLITYTIKHLAKAIWTQIETMAIALHSGISKRYALPADIAREVLSTKIVPLVIFPVLQAWQWLKSVLMGVSAIHTTPTTVSWSACKIGFAGFRNALPETALSALVSACFAQAKQSISLTRSFILLVSLPANSAQKAKSWFAGSRAAPITWDVSEMEINTPSTDRRARLDSRELAQVYDMLLKSSEVFGQLNNQQKVDVIAHITKDIVNFEKGVGHVYAPRKAFFIAAQMIEFQSGVNRDHFEVFARLKVGRVASEAKKQKRSIFAVLIYCVFMVTCGYPKMEQPESTPSQAKGEAEDDMAEKETGDPAAREQCAKATSETSAHREIVSSDSGYGGSP